MRCVVMVPVSPCRNVEVTLHLISLQTAIDPTRVNSIAPPQLGSLGELLPGIPPHFAENMVHMRVGFLLR